MLKKWNLSEACPSSETVNSKVPWLIHVTRHSIAEDILILFAKTAYPETVKSTILQTRNFFFWDVIAMQEFICKATSQTKNDTGFDEPVWRICCRTVSVDLFFFSTSSVQFVTSATLRWKTDGKFRSLDLGVWASAEGPTQTRWDWWSRAFQRLRRWQNRSKCCFPIIESAHRSLIFYSGDEYRARDLSLRAKSSWKTQTNAAPYFSAISETWYLTFIAFL